MIKYLIERPIAVFMSFTALFILGAVTYFTLPVSLLPDIDIPEITVQINGANTSARELENNIVKPVRNQLLQVGKLRDIRSEARDGSALIRLTFDYGTNTDLAFIEVNEKIDLAMSGLSRDVERPRVVKANTTDIPVFYVNMTQKVKGNASADDELGFLRLSELAETVIKRRIEQLPEVVMADITGVVYYQLQLRPNQQIMQVSGITSDDIRNALVSNNVEPGSMKVRDGFYEYNIKFSSILRSPEDVENILLRKNDRVFRLKDISEIEIVAQRQTGVSLANNKRTVTLAVIKQSEENMDNMKKSLNETLDYFRAQNPDIDFEVTRNQTELLDYTISNLQQNMVLSFIFILFISFIFMGDMKLSLIIGSSMVVSIVICAIFFYMFGRSLNIISLAGLITALGMMIDNSIIVTDNITRYRDEGLSVDNACCKGTEEVITPMLSSSLTTVAVFVPLVFMSGIAGAIFSDEAFSITIGLCVSYFTGIVFLPVVYKMVYSRKKKKEDADGGLRAKVIHRIVSRFNYYNRMLTTGMERYYHAGIEYTFRHKRLNALIFIAVFPICVVMFYIIGKERMPQIDQQELLIRLDWNENLHLDESVRRVRDILHSIESKEVTEHSAFVGQQQFLLNRDVELSSSEAELYIKTATPEAIKPLENSLRSVISGKYPHAAFSFAPPATLFEKIFSTGEPELTVELYARNREKIPEADSIRALEQRINNKTSERSSGITFDNQLNLTIDRTKLMLYNVDYNEVIALLSTAFNVNNITTLHSYQQYLPITLVGEEKTINRLLAETLVDSRRSSDGKVYPVPLRELVQISPSEELKSITAGKTDEYIPITYFDIDKPDKLMKTAGEEVRKQGIFDVAFSGRFFANEQMMHEMVIILAVSLLLMYFILASQFESFLQPLIVLSEIPIDIAGALVILYICGHTLNLMSAIGIIITCGVVINDSILKIEVINQLRKEGMPVMKAIHEAGHRRLRAIVMTSLTTILGMVPLLFTKDMGSELQSPLAIAMIGAMVIGTIVSLFMIPLAYWAIYRKSEVVDRSK